MHNESLALARDRTAKTIEEKRVRPWRRGEASSDNGVGLVSENGLTVIPSGYIRATGALRLLEGRCLWHGTSVG